MILKYNIDIQDATVYSNLSRLTNQIYKLLPCREEGSDWEKPLATLMEEISGLFRLLPDHHKTLFPLLCKMEGLFTLEDDSMFFEYRRTIFECLNLMGTLQRECQCQE